MTKMINMEFNGKAVSVPDGMTLVDAAATVGIHIPNLCHIQELRGVGACRMCMVEIEGMKTPLTACTTRVKEGMKVATSTPRVEEIRKFVVDLILSFHPLDCMTCPKAGACDLQRYAADLGLRESSFGRKSFNYELNDRSPFITIDNNYCILCGRCVRVCKEQGTNVLDFMGRGIATKVSTALDMPLHESGCTFCGSCVDACPVNTIMERDRWQHGREWDLEKVETACASCGSGCMVVTSSKDGRIVKVNAKEDNGYICAIGRFGFDSMNSSKSGNRITTPMKKEGGRLVPTTWDDAVKIAADGLKKAGANAGFIVSGALTNEEAYAVQSLSRDVLGIANIDTTASGYAAGAISALRQAYGNAGVSIASQSGLRSADFVMLIGAAPSQKRQVMQELDVMIRRRAQAGAKVVVVDPEKIEITSHQNAIHLAVSPGADAALLSGVMSAALAEGLTSGTKGVEALKKNLISIDESVKISGADPEKIVAAAKAYAASQRPVLIFGSGVEMNHDAVLQIINLAMLKNAGIIPVMLEANSLGVMQMGCLPDMGPGYAAIKKSGKGYVEMTAGMKALYVAGGVQDDIRADFIVLQASHMTELAKKADVVLPMIALYEKQGTIVNTYGVQRSLTQAQKPAGDAKDGIDIASEISLAVSKTKGFKPKDVLSDVKKIKAAKPGAGAFQAVSAKAGKSPGVSAHKTLRALNQGMLSGSAVIKVMETKEAVAR